MKQISLNEKLELVLGAATALAVINSKKDFPLEKQEKAEVTLQLRDLLNVTSVMLIEDLFPDVTNRDEAMEKLSEFSSEAVNMCIAMNRSGISVATIMDRGNKNDQ